ncbi:MAG: hypothetical protein PHE52_02505 [Candidatus Pacebacteria bacterium]|nr:hypothetical protein [Candidatus Paceibacterota bacterium]
MDAAKKKKIICLFLYVIFACVLIYFLKPYYFYSILLVLLPPALVNFLWLNRSRRKILLFSVISTLFFAPPIELAARLANAWDVQSIFPRPFDLIPLENMLFAFLNVFWVLSFYEYFVDRDTAGFVSKRLKYLLGIYCLAAVLIYSLYFYNHEVIALNYFQLAVPVLIIPSLIFFLTIPSLYKIKKAVLPTAFFALIFFVYELVSLRIGSWWWPGEYFLSFSLAGKVFPLDDIIIWYLFSTPVLIGGYELFADDWE